MTLLICLAGQIGSGKSSVGRAVAKALGCKHSAFSDYLKAEVVREGGDPTSRQALQELGWRLVQKDPEAFCRAVLAYGAFTPENDFVIDGLRHVEVLRILTRLVVPSTTRLLFLDASEANRSTRVATRYDNVDFRRADAHNVEGELREALPRHSDIVVDADQPFENVVADCLVAIESWR